ncbi:transposase [Sphingomonas sp. 1185]|nr:transposase [Sphingomonas sp. SORGH_AS_0789]MDR6149879.1 transposase [Sphingomonas sp. SORGH_AS_0742]
MNTKLHAIADVNGRRLSFFMTAGQVSDYTGAAALLDDMPSAQWLLGDRGYDADWFRGALYAKGIQACIPGRKSRNEPVRYDKRRYRRAGASRSRSVASRTGAASPHTMTAAQPSSSPPLPSLPPSSAGCDQRVLTLTIMYR